VTINEVQKPREAQLDDEFAKSLGLEGIDQLRGLLRGQLEQENNGLTRTHMKRKLLDQLAANHDFPVPAGMVEAEFNQIWQQLEHEATHEADPAAAREEMEGDRGDYRAIAERRVRLGLLLSEIGQANGVDISSQEMNQLINQAAMQYRPADREKFVQYVRNEPMAAAQLRAPLFEDKVVDFLFARAEITDRTVSRAELQAEIESEDGVHVHGPGCGHDHDHDHAHEHAPAAVEAEVATPAAEEVKPKKGRGKKAEAPAEGTAEAEAEAPAKKPRAKKAAAEPAGEAETAEPTGKKSRAKKQG
jgi:trigger factor